MFVTLCFNHILTSLLSVLVCPLGEMVQSLRCLGHPPLSHQSEFLCCPIPPHPTYSTPALCVPCSSLQLHPLSLQLSKPHPQKSKVRALHSTTHTTLCTYVCTSPIQYDVCTYIHHPYSVTYIHTSPIQCDVHTYITHTV